jgi:hypothetical protein
MRLRAEGSLSLFSYRYVPRTGKASQKLRTRVYTALPYAHVWKIASCFRHKRKVYLANYSDYNYQLEHIKSRDCAMAMYP